jgi:starch synthase
VKTPRVLFVASECAGLVKTGGLADVAAALPKALAESGVDVRVMLPGYPAVLVALRGATERVRLAAFAGLPGARILEATLPNGVTGYLLDAPELYARSGGPYQDENGRDWPDNARRFGLLGRAAALLAIDSTPLAWRPDVIHAHDWQAGLAPAYLAMNSRKHAASVMTIHNLAFPGLFDAAALDMLGLPASSWSMYGVEYYGKLSFLKAGLYYADAITTVSPTYAREIKSAPLGMGFEGLLASRGDELHGILNGIDDGAWNPRADPFIAARYSASSLWRKPRNKLALQAAYALAPRRDVPLFGLVSRLTQQKGVDLIAAAAERLVALPAQLVVLGEGERELEAALAQAAHRHAQSIGVQIRFDEALAHMIEAGADAFLMPSRFEPCGMNQMYSQRYGTPPIVHATGGLADSVVDCSEQTLADGTATGFTFAEPTQEAALAAIERAVALWRDERAWRRLQKSAMSRDFGWAVSARQYARLYRDVAARVTPTA